MVYCRKCEKGWLINKETLEAQKCECLNKYQRSVENKIIINNSNLPQSILNYSIEKYIGPDQNKNLDKLKKFVDEFETKFKNIHLYIYGKNSCQKTTVISYFAKEVARKGFQVTYVVMNELIKNLCSEQFEDDLKGLIQKYYECDLLVIDESFDKSKVTLWKSGHQIPFLDEFIRKRLERDKKSTIFISNVEIGEIDLSFGVSIKSLIERNCNKSYLEFLDNINFKNDFQVENLWD
jgi:DNA replication protein DnaC